MVLAAGFRHPALLAKMAGALQELADGRLVLGVGTGKMRIELDSVVLRAFSRCEPGVRAPTADEKRTLAELDQRSGELDAELANKLLLRLEKVDVLLLIDEKPVIKLLRHIIMD